MNEVHLTESEIQELFNVEWCHQEFSSIFDEELEQYELEVY